MVSNTVEQCLTISSTLEMVHVHERICIHMLFLKGTVFEGRLDVMKCRESEIHLSNKIGIQSYKDNCRTNTTSSIKSRKDASEVAPVTTELVLEENCVSSRIARPC